MARWSVKVWRLRVWIHRTPDRGAWCFPDQRRAALAVAGWALNVRMDASSTTY